MVGNDTLDVHSETQKVVWGLRSHRISFKNILTGITTLHSRTIEVELSWWQNSLDAEAVAIWIFEGQVGKTRTKKRERLLLGLLITSSISGIDAGMNWINEMRKFVWIYDEIYLEIKVRAI